MLNIFSSIIDTDFTFGSYLLCLVISLVCGALAAVSAGYKSRVSKGFLTAVVLLPAIVATVIIMVNGNVGTGVAVMGAFSLIRFRSVPGKARDIVSIFQAMAAGLACAAGYVYIALLFTALIALLMILLTSLPLRENRTQDLHITVPESLNFSNAFDEVFDKYTTSHRLVKVKTSNMGSLYKLLFAVELKKEGSEKAFMDELRCLNGNLEISLCASAEGGDEL